MPIIPEKRPLKVKRGPAIAITGGVLVVLLSLPFVLTLFPSGIRVGRHGVHARWGHEQSGLGGMSGGMMDDMGPVTFRRIEVQCFGGRAKSYVLTYWKPLAPLSP